MSALLSVGFKTVVTPSDPPAEDKELFNFEKFRFVVHETIGEFESNALIDKLKDGSLQRAHYGRLLSILFHQTYYAPYTFALAAVNCSYSLIDAKEYLLAHAHEEMTHWRWVLDDLSALGESHANLQSEEPNAACAGYIGYNRHIADVFPVGRLAIASVLEGIAARFGDEYGRLLLQHLALGPEHASFFLSHGTTDAVHIQELDEVLSRLALSPSEWARMAEVARNAGLLYRRMYDEAAYAE